MAVVALSFTFNMLFVCFYVPLGASYHSREKVGGGGMEGKGRQVVVAGNFLLPVSSLGARVGEYIN